MIARVAACGILVGVAAIAACEDGQNGTISNPEAGVYVPPEASTPAPVDAASDACSDCDAVKASLSGLRWEIPCKDAPPGTGCAADNPTPKTVTLAGAAGTTYDVTLRFRGVVEAQTYTAIAASPTATGTNAPFFAPNATWTDNGHNAYRLTISKPSFTGFLNHQPSASPSALPAHSFATDYTVTIPVEAGADVTLFATAADGAQYKNIDAETNGNPIVVPDIPPAPNAYDGQFVQMDVVSITKR